MDLDAYRDPQLLTEIASGDSVTQRGLARKYGLALGLTNFLLRRLIKKGHVKIVNLKRNRLRYLLTPTGMAQKARLTYEYLDYSLALYRQIRTLLTRTLSVILQSGGKRIVLCGTGELAEIAYVLMQQRGLQIVAVVEDGTNGATFMSQPVRHLSAIPTLSFDRLVVASFTDHHKLLHQLARWGGPPDRIITVPEGERAPWLGEPTPAFLEETATEVRS